MVSLIGFRQEQSLPNVTVLSWYTAMNEKVKANFDYIPLDATRFFYNQRLFST